MPTPMSYEIFLHLCDTLEIKNNSRADRDRRLYNELRVKLGMMRLKPKEFFAQNPQFTEAKVFVAFLDVMEPFAKMLELIYDICSRASRGGTGGHDLSIRYDSNADSLRFDLEAFKRYRRISEAVRFKGIVPKFHSDYVPGYSMILEQMAAGPPIRWWSDLTTGPETTLYEFLKLLSSATSVGKAHLTMLDAISNRLTEAPAEGDGFQAWLMSLGVSGDYLPYSTESLQHWRDSIEKGLASIAKIRAKDLFQTLSIDERKQAVDTLERILDALAVVQDMKDWRDSVEEWLELPYWKKRWQVYEVWVIGLILRSVLMAGGTLNPDPNGQLVLRTGASSEPLAKLRLNAKCQMEVWCEFPLPSVSNPKFRPDIVIVLRSGIGQIPLHFVECKQRASEGLSRILKDACKYIGFMPIGSDHLLVNYDKWDASPLKKVSEGRSILAVGEMRPDGVGLAPIEQFLTRMFGIVHLWVILVDTTGSMRERIPQIAYSIRRFKSHLVGENSMWLVLFGDHKDVYTVQFQLESDDPDRIAEALLAAPQTNGDDEPEAHEDALHFVREKLHERNQRTAEIVLFSDTRSHTSEECPHGYDFTEEMRLLQQDGHQITLVCCGKDPHSLGWDQFPGVRAVTFDLLGW